MFLIAAISHELIREESILIEEAENIFKFNKGVKGGIWRNTKYILYSGTPIAWAYQNFPGNRTNSSLEDWNPNFDYILKNKS